MLGMSASAAESQAELENKKEKIQSEIDSAEDKIDKLAKEKSDTQEYIAAIDKKIQLLQDQINVLQADADSLQVEIDELNANIEQTEKDIVATQEAIDQKQAEFDKTYADYCQRLRAMYISGHATNLEVLLTSTDISSILTRSQMIKSVSKQDSDTLDSLMKQMQEIENQKVDLEQKRNGLKDSKQQLETDKARLQSNIDEIDSNKREYNAEVQKCNDLIKKLSSETSEYQESIDENQDRLAEVEREIQAAYAKASSTGAHATGSMGGSSGTGAYKGTLGYPTSSRSVSAGYPNYSSGRYHGGVDFRCPSGTSVNAAAAGTVIVAKNLNYSYGHYLIIDHGNGLSTLYAHNTTLLVGVGDKVKKGQLIAKSGSTGNSTGPHCHFEVRVNGTRVNPWNYL